MSDCAHLTEDATTGVEAALGAVDCVSNEATARAFAGLFAQGGALTPALHIILTLYIAIFAVALLTGRSRIGVAALTPRMMTLGLVLTFATSWLAYQSVVWNLAVGAPDQIARVLMGSDGSASALFARRIDVVFRAIADAATGAGAVSAQGAGDAAGAGANASASFTPANLMWLAALLLLLGTAGVLVAARIALVVLLVVGPVFIVLALFNGTRGLFAGWVKGVVLTALVPLFAVLGGGIILELVVPVVGAMNGVDGISAGSAVALFVLAAVHIALMAMVLRVTGAMVAGWSVFGLSAQGGADRSTHGPPVWTPRATMHPVPVQPAYPERSGAVIARSVVPAVIDGPAAPVPSVSRRMVVTDSTGGIAGPPPHAMRARASGVGSRFAPAARPSREISR